MVEIYFQIVQGKSMYLYRRARKEVNVAMQ